MRERHLIAFLTTVQFIHIVDFVMMMLLGPLLMHELGIGTVEFSWLLSSYTFAAALSGIFAGFIIDRGDRRAFLLPLLLLFSFATMACGWAPTLCWMIIARAAAGFFGGALGALTMAIVPDAIPPERRGRALGIIMAAFSIASIIGIPIGMTLAVHFGWHAPFWWLGGAGLVVAAWAYGAFPHMVGHIHAVQATPLQTLTAIFRVPAHWRAFALSVSLVMAGFTVIPFISPYLVGNLGFSNDQLHYVYLAGGIASVVTSPLIGRLADRYGARWIFVGVALLSVVPLVGVTTLPVLGMTITLLVTSAFIVLVSGRFVPAMTLIANGVEPRLRGSFMGFHSAIQSLAMGLAAQVAGHLVTKAADGSIQHYPRVGWLAAGCTLLAIAIALTIRPAPLQSPRTKSFP
jgi:predicted MFS family arabinose efflux permease